MLYSEERHIQQLVSLLKQHGIRRIVASPGSSNVPLVASLQADSHFDMISCIDERSAAYIACGICGETGEPVVITCTGATASRNYLPGMTEAYYRKLPILAVTASMNPDRIGHLYPQLMDRRSQQRDVSLKSVTIKPIRTNEDRWANEIAINDAILEMNRHGGGPAHINMVSEFETAYTAKELIPTRMITRHFAADKTVPELPEGSIAIFVGSHAPWDEELTKLVDAFCNAHNAVVIVDHTSNYTGKYGVLASIVSIQEQARSQLLDMDLLIHIGEVSGSYIRLKPKQVWRVSPDGEIRDQFKTLSRVFEMTEQQFFARYSIKDALDRPAYYDKLASERSRLIEKLPELPFSNLWCAAYSASRVPCNAVMHFAILNSLRSWNMFEIDRSVECYANTGGFGIDGCTSSMIGGAIAQSTKVHYLVTGDLAFFYDLNAMGIRNFPANARIMLINNGIGVEFKNHSSSSAQFGSDADSYIAAKGHNGAQSREFVKGISLSLGFRYLKAESKVEFSQCAQEFFAAEPSDKPVLFEVFTSDGDETAALEVVANLDTSLKGVAKKTAKKVLGEKGKATVKKMLGR